MDILLNSNYSEEVTNFIHHAKTYRDKALWSCLAATSGRISEVLQLVLCDVNPQDRTIFFIDYKNRLNNSIYDGLQPNEK